MSGGHFAGILTLLTCRGSKGQSPLASLGTAQRLAPVQSGLPLCETCLSAPHHWTRTRQTTFFPLRYQLKMEMTVVLWCRNWLWKKENSSTFHRFFLSETGWSCTTPMRSIGQSCAVSGTLYLFFACLYNSLIYKHLSVIFPCYFCLSFSESLSSSAEKHKNSSHERFTDFYQSKCHHCHRLFLLFCFCKTIPYCQSVFLLLLFYFVANFKKVMQ